MQGRPESGYRLTQKRIDVGALTPELLKMHLALEEAKKLARDTGIKANTFRLTPETRKDINEAVDVKATKKFERVAA